VFQVLQYLARATGWLRTIRRKALLAEICLFFFFNSLQGLGESPNLNLCDLNDFFEDFSSLSSLAHLSFYVTLLLSLVGEKNQE
jgi:hypothetical protein